MLRARRTQGLEGATKQAFRVAGTCSIQTRERGIEAICNERKRQSEPVQAAAGAGQRETGGIDRDAGAGGGSGGGGVFVQSAKDNFWSDQEAGGCSLLPAPHIAIAWCCCVLR
jgi:hypothetical protein